MKGKYKYIVYKESNIQKQLVNLTDILFLLICCGVDEAKLKIVILS